MSCCVRFHECAYIGFLCSAAVLHVDSTHSSPVDVHVVVKARYKIGLELCVINIF